MAAIRYCAASFGWSGSKSAARRSHRVSICSLAPGTICLMAFRFFASTTTPPTACTSLPSAAICSSLSVRFTFGRPRTLAVNRSAAVWSSFSCVSSTRAWRSSPYVRIVSVACTRTATASTVNCPSRGLVGPLSGLVSARRRWFIAIVSSRIWTNSRPLTSPRAAVASLKLRTAARCGVVRPQPDATMLSARSVAQGPAMRGMMRPKPPKLRCGHRALTDTPSLVRIVRISPH